MKCRTSIIGGLAAILLCVPMSRGQATAPATQGAAAATTAPAEEAVNILNMLQQRDQTLKDFTAKIRYEVYHPRTDDTEVQIGDVAYLKADDGTKFAVHFIKQGVVGGGFSPADKTIMFDGRWVVDSDALAKIYQKTEIVPPGSKVQPLKLGEGPLPLPIGQDTQKVLHDFDVTVEPTDAKVFDAADVVHLKLAPKNANLTKIYDMSSLEIWVSRKLELPIRLAREGLDGNTTTIALDTVAINQGAAKVFDLPTPKASDGWDIRIDALPAAGAGAKN